MINLGLLTEDSRILVNFIKNNLIFEGTNHNLKTFNKLAKNIIKHYYRISNTSNNIKINISQKYITNKINKLELGGSGSLPKIILVLRELFDNHEDLLQKKILKKFPSQQYNTFKSLCTSKTYDSDAEAINTEFNGNYLEMYREVCYALTQHHLPDEIYKKYFPENYPSLEIYGGFVSIDVQLEVEQDIKKVYIVRCKKTQGIDLNITFEMYTNEKPSMTFIKRLITKLELLTIMNNMVKRDIHIRMWLTSRKKEIAGKVKVLGPRNVNTGATYLNNSREITIWRLEELEKVANHEYLHSIRVDYDIQDFNKEFNKKIKQYICISDDNHIKLFETYTELWTTIINIIVNSYELQKIRGIQSFQEFSQNLVAVYNMEVNFCLYQIAKILNLFGYSKYEEFWHPTMCNNNRNPKEFIQTSSIISYYILKTALLFNINGFLSFAYNNNNHFIKFSSLCSNYKKFETLIIDSMSNRMFGLCINRYLAKIRENKYELTDSIINSNLRMTLFELSF
jgi:hypothetical protein